MESIIVWVAAALGDKVDPHVWVVCLGALWGVSEALSLIPSVKANGVFQLVFNIIQRLYGTAKR